ncbi:MAG: cation:proton antiporter [Nitrospiraceae bacterium]
MLPIRRLLFPLLTALLVVVLWNSFGVATTPGGDPNGPETGERTVSVPADQNEYAKAVSATENSEHSQAGGHVDPFSFIMFELALIILLAMVGRWVCGRVNQPAVLGELLIGVIVGNVLYAMERPVSTLVMHMSEAGKIFREVWVSGLSVSEAAKKVLPATELEPGAVGSQILSIMTGPHAELYIEMAIALWIFSNLGVILLLFMVGLESRVDEMLKVGPRALLVAITGIVAPFALAFAVTLWLLPEDPMPSHLFVAAIMCATSVGITARVFKDFGRLQSKEAKVILGAAVIDDVLGLIILAVVVGIVAAGTVHLFEVGRIVLLSSLFMGTVILFGERFVRFSIPLVCALDRHHSKVLFPLGLCFLMAWLANQIELATIVGAFAAGLILNEEHFAKYSDEKLTMEEVQKPAEAIFAPIFFVLMGMQVNLESFFAPEALWLALAFTVVGLVGKLIAGLPAGRDLDRLTVGIGMVPRGEVGLIMASVGKGLGVMSEGVFTAIVIAIIATTLIAPIGLKWSLFRGKKVSPAPTP